MMSSTFLNTSFKIGSRTYFVVFSLSSDGELKYGATVHKAGFVGEKPDYESHFQTATSRFTRFPVRVKNFTGNYALSESVKTRSDSTKFYNSKIFRKLLLKQFCKYGVRSRPIDTSSSLKLKEFNLAYSNIKKTQNRDIDNYYNLLKRHINNNPGMYSSRHRTGVLDYRNNEKLSKSIPFELKIQMDKRVFHIVYRRNNQGETLYGASIYRLIDGNKIGDEYDQELHFDTAYERLERFPVSVFLKNTHRYVTRSCTSGEIEFWNNKVIKQFRKLIAKNGVRFRDTTHNSRKFLVTHALDYQIAQNKKKTNLRKAKLDNSFSRWRQVRTI